MSGNKDDSTLNNQNVNNGQNEKVSTPGNEDNSNTEEQPSDTPIEPDSNQEGNKDGLIQSLTGLLSGVLEKAPGIATSAGAVILGFIAVWKGFGQWWFGFQISTWVLIVIAVALNIVWLTAVCGYLAGLEKNKPKFPRLNTVFMIALPALVLGILFGYIAIRWRLTDKIVILVEPFEKIGGVKDGNASEKELEGIAGTIKSELDRVIQEQEKRLDVRVVLGKRREQDLSEEAQLEEHALKYRADMVISGWYVERGDDTNTEFMVCPKFQVVRVPKSLPAEFRARESFYPETIVFGRKEIENLNMNFTLKFSEQLTYEPTLVLGAGAYASGDWKTAQQLFAEALSIIEEPNSPEKESKTKAEPTEREPETKVKEPGKESESNKNDAGSTENENLKGDANTVSAAKDTESSEKESKTNAESSEKDSQEKKRDESINRQKHIEGDKALLHLYIGHCLINRSQYENAILRYDDAIEAGKKIRRGDLRYGEILASAYLARGAAYRQVNAFELARQDFEKAGGHLPTSLGLKPLRAEEARFLSGDREKLVNGAEKYYRRGEEYLIQREYPHAQAHLEMSVEFYRRLMKGMPTHVQNEYSLDLAESLIRLGETHNRLAKPELRDDENTKLAIKHLDEAISLTRRFGDQEDRNILEIRADGLRHLGEAYRAQDQNDVVEEALRYHADANSIWLDLEKLKNTEEQKTKIVRKVAGEKTRIGNVYRWLDDLEPDPNHLKKAISAYKEAIRKLGGEEYLKIPYPDSNDHQVDVNEVKKNLICKTTKKIIIHHLAHSACSLAETHIKRSLDESEKEDKERDKKKIENDIRTACELLEYATKCYRVAVDELHKKENKEWIKRIRYEERNLDLRDDLAWSLTLYGYALIKQGPSDSNDPNDYYEQVTQILTEAWVYLNELRYADQGHTVLNLFALTLPQFKLGKHQASQQTFLDACNLLRDLTREKKKVWYMDHVCDVMNELRSEGFQVADLQEDKCNFDKLQMWLKASRVREGRRSLDKIIKSMQKKLKAAGDLDS